MGEPRATAIAMTVTGVEQPGPRLVVRLTDRERTWTWETELVPHRITEVTQLMDAAGLRWPTDNELDVLALAPLAWLDLEAEAAAGHRLQLGA